MLGTGNFGNKWSAYQEQLMLGNKQAVNPYPELAAKGCIPVWQEHKLSQEELNGVRTSLHGQGMTFFWVRGSMHARWGGGGCTVQEWGNLHHCAASAWVGGAVAVRTSGSHDPLN